MRLTSRQSEVLEFVRGYLHEHGMPPTRNDIRLKFGFSSMNAAEDHLKALARKGAVILIPGISRGIRLPASEAA